MKELHGESWGTETETETDEVSFGVLCCLGFFFLGGSTLPSSALFPCLCILFSVLPLLARKGGFDIYTYRRLSRLFRRSSPLARLFAARTCSSKRGERRTSNEATEGRNAKKSRKAGQDETKRNERALEDDIAGSGLNTTSSSVVVVSAAATAATATATVAAG